MGECQSLILSTLTYIQDQRYTPAKRNATEAQALAETIGDQESLWSAQQYLEAIAEATMYEENVDVGYQAPPGANRSQAGGHHGYPAAGRGSPASRKAKREDPS